MRKALTLLIALLCANLALAQNKPLACQVDVAAGLKWENGQWQTARFKEDKFILVMSGDTLTKESVIKATNPNLDSNRLVEQVSCKQWVLDSVISCFIWPSTVLIFNPKTLKGGISKIYGATQNTADRDTPYIEAFTCQGF